MLTEILTRKHGQLPDDILERLRRYDARRLLDEVGIRVVLADSLEEVSRILKDS